MLTAALWPDLKEHIDKFSAESFCYLLEAFHKIQDYFQDIV